MNDNQTILELYDMFMDQIYIMTPENYKLSTEISDLEDKLNSTLTKEQQELLESINEKESERVEEVYKNVFVFSYKLATKLLVEGLSSEKMIDNIKCDTMKEKMKG